MIGNCKNIFILFNKLGLELQLYPNSPNKKTFLSLEHSQPLNNLGFRGTTPKQSKVHIKLLIPPKLNRLND